MGDEDGESGERGEQQIACARRKQAVIIAGIGMSRTAKALLGLGGAIAAALAGLYLFPEEREPAATGQERDFFEGEAGPLDLGTAFTEFVREHQGEAVDLEVRIPERVFEGTSNEFFIAEECPAGGSGPRAGRCEGTEYRISGAGRIAKKDGAYRLAGRFRVDRRSASLVWLRTIE